MMTQVESLVMHFDRRVLSVAICFMGIASVAADQSSKETSRSPKITFEEHIQPIFRQHCSSCHHQGDKKGGLAVDTFTAIFEGGASGEVVDEDGDYKNSRLWQLVNHDDTPPMPPRKDRLPPNELELIRKWIEGGSLQDNGSKAKARKKNPLAFVATSSGRPEGGGTMPRASR